MTNTTSPTFKLLCPTKRERMGFEHCLLITHTLFLCSEKFKIDPLFVKRLVRHF
jgi:hypothetical protein